jgi:hypothetical protein
VGVALLLALIYPAVTYAQALTYPGNATVAVRTVDWLRDSMGAGALVDAVENWWYGRHAPANTQPAANTVPHQLAHQAKPVGSRPAKLATHGVPLRGEGAWVPADSQGAVYTTFFRPDTQHASVLAGAAWINQDLVTTQLVPGTREPVPNRSAPARVPASDRSRLVAVFNSGFKMVDANGGAYLNGQTLVPLRNGAASLVIHRDGTVSIAQWGRDAHLTNDVVAVRQNLDLIVDHGHVVSGLDVNRDARWGSSRSQFQYTWRSGIGTDSAGHLIYVAGNQLTLATLAEAMSQAGIVHGMQLDIHSDMVAFNTYDPGHSSFARKLLPAIPGPADRYLSTDLRDFFTVTLRSGPHTSAGARSMSH